MVSHKITNETGYIGYSVLSHIGINTSKVNFLGSTRHFCTYAIIEDLELPFDLHSGWKKFTIKDTVFHPYHKGGRHLILIHHEESCLMHGDEIDAFIDSKEKEKKEIQGGNLEMGEIIKKDHFIFVSDDAVKEKCGDVTKHWDFIDKILEIDTFMLTFRTFSRCEGFAVFRTTRDIKLPEFFGPEKFINGLFGYIYNGDLVVLRDTQAPFLAECRIDKYLDEHEHTFIALRKKREEEEKKNMLNNNTMPRGLGRSAAISMLNSFYGLNGGLNNKRPPLKFKLIFGQEHATGRYKTICLWEDGVKTIIHGDNKVTKLPVAQAFAWCYVKRTFGTVSHFKKHVDKRTTKMDGVWYFEGDCIMDDYAQGSVPGTSKKRDIYDAAALAIVTKRYGGLRKLVDEHINKEDE